MDDIITRSDILDWIKEDMYFWDNSSINLKSSEIGAKIIAKQDGMISGTQVAKIIFQEFGIEITSVVDEGSLVKHGDIILELRGNSSKILQAERSCLNIFSHMSGISTATMNLLSKMRDINPKVRLAATRKTLPGLRRYQKWAVVVGGGDTHRMSLSSMIMLKENHISLFENISDAINFTRENSSFSLKIEVEVRNNEEAMEAIKAGADIIMLDNYKPPQIAEILPILREHNLGILIEASGNISEENILDYVKSDVDIISMGKLTHSSQVFDMSMVFDKVN